MHYGPYLEELCRGIIEYSRKEGDGKDYDDLDIPQGANGGDSRMVRKYVEWQERNRELNYDLVLLNCGLHDIKTVNRVVQIELPEYRENLRSIMEIYRRNRIEVIWIRTTPVFEEIHNAKSSEFQRYTADVPLYNDAADSVIAASGVSAEVDLYNFTLPFLPDGFCDHVHFKEHVRKAQAEYIFSAVTDAIDRRKKSAEPLLWARKAAPKNPEVNK